MSPFHLDVSRLNDNLRLQVEGRVKADNLAFATLLKSENIEELTEIETLSEIQRKSLKSSYYRLGLTRRVRRILKLEYAQDNAMMQLFKEDIIDYLDDEEWTFFFRGTLKEQKWLLESGGMGCTIPLEVVDTSWSLAPVRNILNRPKVERALAAAQVQMEETHQLQNEVPNVQPDNEHVYDNRPSDEIQSHGEDLIDFVPYNNNDGYRGTYHNNDGYRGTYHNSDGYRGTYNNNDGYHGTYNNNDGYRGTYNNNDGCRGTYNNHDGGYRSPYNQGGGYHRQIQGHHQGYNYSHFRYQNGHDHTRRYNVDHRQKRPHGSANNSHRQIQGHHQGYNYSHFRYQNGHDHTRRYNVDHRQKRPHGSANNSRKRPHY